MANIEELHSSRIKEFKRHRASEPMSKEEMEYLLDVMPVLKEYYDEQQYVSERAFKGSPPKKRKGSTRASSSSSKVNTMEEYTDKEAISNQGTLRYRYILATADPTSSEWATAFNALRAQEERGGECLQCQVPMHYVQADAMIACPRCGISSPHQEDSSMTYDQEISRTQTPSFAYKRINHLIESIAQLQGKQTTVIPDEVLNAVKAEFKKARIDSVKDITPLKVRQYLKKLGLSRYYEHVSYICRLLGVQPPVLSEDLEERLKTMFLAIQAPFAKACPANRSNFCSYSYVLHKLVQLLGHDELLPYFPLLKSRQKLAAHDQIWKAICSELKWEFIRSI